MIMVCTSNILMIRPVNFTFNEQTALSNAFQNKPEQEHIQPPVLKEFNQFVQLLTDNGINVTVMADTLFPHTPDSIFPNNWISFHDDGSIFLYPMQAENRRLERKPHIINALKKTFRVKQIHDLSYFENENQFLEGTGSMVLDRENKIVYAALSPRTCLPVLKEFCARTGYTSIYFHTVDANTIPIYHTNVMMCLGSGFAVICMESISDQEEKTKVYKSLSATRKEIIEISLHQLKHFAGNMIQLVNNSGELLLVMSGAALNCLSENQRFRLEKYGRLVCSPLNVIEAVGGGSARCMIGEIFLPKLSE